SEYVLVLFLFFLFFFFFFSSRRRHTRSDRDWSSDVCSSDLRPATAAPRRAIRTPSRTPAAAGDQRGVRAGSSRRRIHGASDQDRSEERRVGKECRSRWWPDH